MIKLRDFDGNLSKRWCIYHYPDNDSYKRKIIWIPLKLKTLKERYAHAERIINELNAEENPKKNFKKDKNLLIPALDRCLEVKEQTVHSRGSYANFKYRVRDLKDWLIKKRLKNLEVEKFTKQDAICFLEDVYIKSKISNRTINGYLSYLKPIFSYLQKTYDLPVNVFEKIEKLKTKEPEINIWTNQERTKIAEIFKTKEKKMFIAMLMIFHCFIRNSEILKLQIKDIDFEKNIIKILASKSKSNKCKYPTMSNQLAKLLKKHCENYNPEYYIFSDRMQPGERKLFRDYLSKRFKKIKENYGLNPKLKLYHLKHTGNSWWIDRGASVQELKEQNGHSETRTTEIYIKRISIKTNYKFMNESPEL